MRVAVPPVTQPPHAKPTTMVATMQLALDQNQTPLVGRYASQRLPRLNGLWMLSGISASLSVTQRRHFYAINARRIKAFPWTASARPFSWGPGARRSNYRAFNAIQTTEQSATIS